MLSTQVIKNVSLMNVNSDKSLKLDSLKLGEIISCLINEQVEEVKELLVSRQHYLLVIAGPFESGLRVHSPYHLYAEETHLRRVQVDELEEVKPFL